MRRQEGLTEQNTQGKCTFGSKLKNKGLFHLLRQTQCKGVQEYINTHITWVEGRWGKNTFHLSWTLPQLTFTVEGRAVIPTEQTGTVRASLVNVAPKDSGRVNGSTKTQSPSSLSFSPLLLLLFYHTYFLFCFLYM